MGITRSFSFRPRNRHRGYLSRTDRPRSRLILAFRPSCSKTRATISTASRRSSHWPFIRAIADSNAARRSAPIGNGSYSRTWRHMSRTTRKRGSLVGANGSRGTHLPLLMHYPGRPHGRSSVKRAPRCLHRSQRRRLPMSLTIDAHPADCAIVSRFGTVKRPQFRHTMNTGRPHSANDASVPGNGGCFAGMFLRRPSR